MELQSTEDVAVINRRLTASPASTYSPPPMLKYKNSLAEKGSACRPFFPSPPSHLPGESFKTRTCTKRPPPLVTALVNTSLIPSKWVSVTFHAKSAPSTWPHDASSCRSRTSVEEISDASPSSSSVHGGHHPNVQETKAAEARVVVAQTIGPTHAASNAILGLTL
jgi:hypothetical protein